MGARGGEGARQEEGEDEEKEVLEAELHFVGVGNGR